MMQSAGIVVNDVTVTWRNGHTALRDASHSTKVDLLPLWLG